MAEFDSRLAIGLFVALVSLISIVLGCFIRHVSKGRRHPCSDDIVYKDVCAEKTKGLNDCIEGAVNLMKIQYENLNTKVDKGFKDLKEFIKNNHK